MLFSYSVVARWWCYISWRLILIWVLTWTTRGGELLYLDTRSLIHLLLRCSRHCASFRCKISRSVASWVVIWLLSWTYVWFIEKVEGRIASRLGCWSVLKSWWFLCKLFDILVKWFINKLSGCHPGWHCLEHLYWSGE